MSSDDGLVNSPQRESRIRSPNQLFALGGKYFHHSQIIFLLFLPNEILKGGEVLVVEEFLLLDEPA